MTEIPSYDLSIHSNPDARAWARLFQAVVLDAGIVVDEGLMQGWFANAMMAMHDHVKRSEPSQPSLDPLGGGMPPGKKALSEPAVAVSETRAAEASEGETRCTVKLYGGFTCGCRLPCNHHGPAGPADAAKGRLDFERDFDIAPHSTFHMVLASMLELRASVERLTRQAEIDWKAMGVLVANEEALRAELGDEHERLTAVRVACGEATAALASARREATDLRGALAGVLGAYGIDDDGPSGMLDRLGIQFYRETGVWPPFKSAPMEIHIPENTEGERTAQWRFWLAEHRLSVATAARAALAGGEHG